METIGYILILWASMQIRCENIEIICERRSGTIDCGEGHINIHSAIYGRNDSTTCPDRQVSDTTCGVDVAGVIDSSCDGQQQCTLQALNSLAGDPCVGTYKFLNVTYTCQDDRQATDSTADVCPSLAPGIGCLTDDIHVDFNRSLVVIEAECPSILTGDRARVRCDGVRYGSEVVRCVDGGIWNPMSVVCLRDVQCGLPEAPQNGYIVNLRSEYNIFDSIEIRCNDGFDLIGSSSAYCRHDGYWSRKMLQCIPSVDIESCEPPDVSSSVTLTPSARTHLNGSVVSYSCNRPNHGLLGKPSSTCINGRWSPDPGECYELSGSNIQFPQSNCQRRLVPDGVLYSPKQYSYQPGRSVTFTCVSPNYSLIGQPISTCRARGWDSQTPKCVLRCPQPPPRSYTALYPSGQVEFRHEDIIVLECNGGAKISKCVNGLWTPELGFCSQTDVDDITTMIPATRAINRRIAILLQEPVTSSSIDRQLPFLISVTNSPDENILSEDVNNVVSFLEKITSLNSTSPKVTNSVLEVISNIMNVEEIELQTAQEGDNTTNRALDIITQQLNIVDLSSENGSFVISHQNLAVRVSTTTITESVQGSSFAIFSLGDQGEDGLYNRITYGSIDEDFIENGMFQASVILPSLVHFDSKASSSGKDSFRVSFVAYQKTSLFVSLTLETLNSRETSFRRRPLTPIIAATVHGMDDEIDDNDKYVTSTFDVGMEPNMIKNVECVYWDVDGNHRRGDWSSRGCRRVPGSSKTRPVCRCRRLANFAVLLDIYDKDFLPLEFRYFAQVLTYIGCGLSTCGLILTIIAYSSSKLRNKQPNQILLCLSLSLLGLYITFMLVIGLGPLMSPIPCGILAAVLHFFALSSLAWMGIEGVNVYLLFVRIINSYIPRFIRKASFFGWGLPAIVVLIIGCIFRQNYARGDMCLIKQWPNITGLLIPVGLILLFNVVIFILVMKRISSTTAGKIQDNPSTRHRERIRRLRNAFILLLLLGLTWVFGFLVNIRNEVLIAFSQTVFVIMNAFQGFFIFVIYCARLPQARMQLAACCRYIYCPFDIVKTSTSDHNKNAKDSKEMSHHDQLKPLPLKRGKESQAESFDTVSTP
ncbi:adhesion G-protein coupled receptor G2-like isoform X2 [Lytechinus variegatus]|uniref:adhesion G-protein coupled receptor G2-like isoform X2 n=1 Tax=Lytechinus variegatus TaxID=7654 RepID=UPI001BB29DA7|nr:adhesion G-protein coupled receptor G2-like isoform X2 [Lytechinus variegatus]